MKFEAVILAAGQGKRLRPLTNERPKSLLYLPGGILLDQQLRLLAELGARRVSVVIGHLAEVMEHHLATSPSAAWFDVTTVRQQRPEGLLNALRDALPTVEPPLLVIHGDSFLGGSLSGFRDALTRGETAIAVRDDDDPGLAPTKDLVSVGPDARVLAFGRRIAGARTANSFGCYAIGPEVSEIIDAVGERGIPDVDMIPVFNDLIRRGGVIRAIPWAGLHRNLNSQAEVLEASRDLLDAWPELDFPRAETGTWFPPGDVHELPGARVTGPAWIGEGTAFDRATIGPYAAVGAGARLERSELRDGIVFPGTLVADRVITAAVVT